MLTYIQNSDSKNAVDDATRMLDSYVMKVKNLPEVEAGYMTLGDWIDGIEEELREDITKEVTEEVTKNVTESVTKSVTKSVTESVTEEVTKNVTESVTKSVTKSVTESVTERVTREVQEQDIRTVIEMLQEYHETKENALTKICARFPGYADKAETLIGEYWQESTVS